MAFRPSMAALDFGGRLPTRVRVLYGYLTGNVTNPDWVELKNQVAEAGGEFVPAHASGNICAADLFELVIALNATVVTARASSAGTHPAEKAPLSRKGPIVEGHRPPGRAPAPCSHR
jgi:hypothetical protein